MRVEPEISLTKFRAAAVCAAVRISPRNASSTFLGARRCSPLTDIVDAVVSDLADGYGTVDNNTITGNKVSGAQLYDAIDLCSDHNTVRSNILYGSAESGVHLDDTCGGTGNNNSVTSNTINEACAGILTGTGTTGNTTSPDTFFNVLNTTMAGDTCTPPPPPGAKGGASRKHASLRPAPFNPMKRK